MLVDCPHIHVKKLRHQLLRQPNRAVLIAHFNTHAGLSGEYQKLPGIMLNHCPRTGLSEALSNFTILRHTVSLDISLIEGFQLQTAAKAQTVASESKPSSLPPRLSHYSSR